MTKDRYIKAVLDLYRATPGTRKRIRPADRRLAGGLFESRIPIETVRTAFVLAVSRRIQRPRNAQPLAMIESLHYFRPMIQEIIDSPLPAGYIEYLTAKLKGSAPRQTIISKHHLLGTKHHQ